MLAIRRLVSLPIIAAALANEWIPEASRSRFGLLGNAYVPEVPLAPNRRRTRFNLSGG